MNIYYAIWADAINYERIQNKGDKHWKIFTFFYSKKRSCLKNKTAFLWYISTN